jgi:predicted anti-sigma-YlaC factor YlaD
MPMAVHAAHESAAWNLALGASFLAVAVKPARAVGTLPILGTFVLVLSVLSIPDIADGTVGEGRLISHAAVVLGLVLVTLMSRSQRLVPVPGAGLQSAPVAESSHPFGRRRGAA